MRLSSGVGGGCWGWWRSCDSFVLRRCVFSFGLDLDLDFAGVYIRVV